MSRVLDLLVNCEQSLDLINSQYGKKNELCVLCGAKEHDGNVGIVHKTDCLILRLRREIKMQEEKSKLLARLKVIDE